ncbi:MAG: tyrosine-type recombinase/integrase [Terracidiphilus sp.]
MNITEISVKQLLTPETGNRIVWDSKLRGFGVRTTAGSVKSFILDYRFKGRQRRYTIGQHPEFSVVAARAEAEDLRKRIRDGHDPMEERNQNRGEPLLSDLMTEYKEDAQNRKRATSLRNDKSMIDKIISPKLGRLRLQAVTERDIATLHASLKETPYRANRVLALLSSIFNFGIKKKWTTLNPARGIDKFAESKRERWLTVEELQKFKEGLDRYKDQKAANALRLLMLTGSREGEVLKAEWEQFDLARGVWTKPSHNTKQKKVEHIPLSGPALKLLEAIVPEDATGPLFPGRRADKNGGARVSLRRPWIQACKAAGLAEEIPFQGKRGPLVRYRPTVRIHDLRHNFASHLASNGVSLQIVGKLLGHTQASTTMRYAHLQDEALRSATNKFGTIFTKAAAKKTTVKKEA